MAPQDLGLRATALHNEGDFMVGKTISHYKVLEKIGEAGMGEVYRAEQGVLCRTYGEASC